MNTWHSPLPDYFTTLYIAPEITYIHFVCVVEIIFPAPLSTALLWELEISHGRRIHNTEIRKCYKSGLFVLFCFVFLRGPVVKCLPALLWVKLTNKVGSFIVRQVLMVRKFFITLKCIPSSLNSTYIFQCFFFFKLVKKSWINTLVQVNVKATHCSHPTHSLHNAWNMVSPGEITVS